MAASMRENFSAILDPMKVTDATPPETDLSVFGKNIHTGGSAFMDVLAEDAQVSLGWGRVGHLHRVKNRADVFAHGCGHGLLVLSVARVDVQHGDAPAIFSGGIQADELSAWGKHSPCASMRK